MNMRPPITLDATQIASVVEEQLVAMTSTLRPDYLSALQAALKSEKSSIGCLALEQLVANARLAQTEGLPLCQDTGYVWVCLEVDGSVLVPGNIFSEVDAAVARAAEAAGMRTSLLHDALVKRVNTANNTPAFCEVLLSSDSCRPSAVLHIMLKGGGSDNASALAMLPPSAGIEGVLEFVVRSVAAKGANACPPLVLGVGVGSTFDKVAGLAKYALLRPLGSTHPNEELAALEKELLARINALGIGPGGLGGSTTALAVHIHSAPCHIASLAVAVSINCTALRTSSTDLSGILAF